MRELINKTNKWLLMLLVLPFMAASCASDKDKENDPSLTGDYCYIQSVTLGSIKRTVVKRDRQGNVISTQNTSYSGNPFHMTVNHREQPVGNGEALPLIENRDSLPYGSDLSRVVVNIAFRGSIITYVNANSMTQAYSTTDSLDLRKPLRLQVFSGDSQTSRTYLLKVNVHQQEGDSLYWNQCGKDVDLLTGMTEAKAFTFDDRLTVIGRKGDKATMMVRSSLDAEGEWQELLPTDASKAVPATADIQTLHEAQGMLWLSTTDGQVYTSGNAADWQPIGEKQAAGLTLVEATANFLYAISDGKMMRSADGITWTEDKLDTDNTKLPSTDIRSLTFVQANGNQRIVMVGNAKDGSKVTWTRMWNANEPEADAEWVFYPESSDNKVPCPRLQHLCILPYDGGCIAFGGASEEGHGTHKAMDAMYISKDYGITWRPSSTLHMPWDLEGTEGCIAATVDKDNYIWIITDGEVWRGRLNRLGFVQR